MCVLQNDAIVLMVLLLYERLKDGAEVISVVLSHLHDVNHVCHHVGVITFSEHPVAFFVAGLVISDYTNW